jgi:hypothetical protein
MSVVPYVPDVHPSPGCLDDFAGRLQGTMTCCGFAPQAGSEHSIQLDVPYCNGSQRSRTQLILGLQKLQQYLFTDSNAVFYEAQRVV